MKNIKLIYIFEFRHCYNYDYKMFQMQYFDKKGISIEIWSLVRWVFNNCEDPKDVCKNSNVFYINNLIDLINNLERVKECKCIFLCYPYHNYSRISFLVRKYIRKYRFDFCNITESPSIDEKVKCLTVTNLNLLIILQFFRFFKRLFISVFKLDLKKISKMFYSFFGPLLYKSKFNFITTKIVNSAFPNWIELCDKKRNILVHSNSYDEYMKANISQNEFLKIKKEYEIPDEYIVLVDDFEIGHSDFLKSGLNMPIKDTDSYLIKLNKFLKYIEKHTGMRVIIAEHPKAEYNRNVFDDRIKIKYNTDLLIKNASLVIIGVSVCLGLVMLYKKRFIGFYSQEFLINTPILKNYYNAAQCELSCKYFDIRDNSCYNNINDYINLYDKQKYDKFIKKYVIEENGVYDKFFYEFVYEILFNS